MDVSVSDMIVTEVKQVNQSGIRGTTSYWENISELIITTHNSNKEIVPGRELTIEIEDISGETAYGKTKRAPYARHVFPGDTIKITPAHFTDDGLAVASYSGSTFDTVYVTDAVPEETVIVRILKITDQTAIAETAETQAPGLEVGDHVDVTIEAGTSTGKPEDGVFDVDLRTEAALTADITVEITNLDGNVEAEIVDPGILPLPGREFQATVERDSRQGRVLEGDYDVRLTAPALATGRVLVKIEQATSSEIPTASIVAYNDLIPIPGEEIQVWSIPETSKAEPVDGTYQIELSGNVPVRARFEVEITGCDGTITGRLANEGSLPIPDNNVEATVERGETRATVVEGEYPIELKHPALVSGEVTIVVDTPPSDDIASGHIGSYQGQLPSVREKVPSITVESQAIARPCEGTYLIELDETLPLEAEVEIEVIDVQKTGITGTIVDRGIVPTEGDTIRGTAFLNKERVHVDKEYIVQIDSPALASGTVMVEVETVSSVQISGRIIEHRSLPSVGEKIRAEINSFETIATPTKGRYEIHLQSTHERSGTATVEITAIDSQVEGKVLKFDSRSRNRKNPMRQSNSKNDLISGGKI